MGPHDAGEDLPESPLCAFVLSWECRLNRLNPHQPTWVSGGTQLIVGGWRTAAGVGQLTGPSCGLVISSDVTGGNQPRQPFQITHLSQDWFHITKSIQYKVI